MIRVKDCHICGKRFVGRYAGRAYAGHMWLSHFVRVGLKGEIIALKKDIEALKSSNAKLESQNIELESRCNDLRLNLGIAEEEMKIERDKLVCLSCFKPIGNVLYHEQLEARLNGKPVRAFRCKSG